MKPFETARLTLRRLTPAELPAVYPQLVREEEGDDAPAEAIEWEIQADAGWNYQPLADKFGRLAIILKAENRVIGTVGLYLFYCPVEVHTLIHSPARAATVEVEIGYSLSRLYRRQGYASEAAAALVNYGFQDLKLHRLFARTTPDNSPSVRVMQRLGMTLWQSEDGQTITGVIEQPPRT